MGIMADNTVTSRHRTMHIVLSGHIVFMAGKTDICQFFLREEKLCIGLVGIMTNYALFFDGGMDIFVL